VIINMAGESVDKDIYHIKEAVPVWS